jgi:hypothetical protein
VGVPARTVSRILRRHQMPYLRELDPMTGEVIRSSKQSAERYERDYPGELVHMDVKKLGKIPDGAGGGFTGWLPPSRKGKRDKIGYDYVHSLIDDTPVAYPKSCPTRKDPPARTSWSGLRRTSPPKASTSNAS